MDKTLKEAIDNLETEISPSRNLWPGIEHSLEAPRRGIHIPLPAIAAMLALFALTLGWGITRQSAPADNTIGALVALLHEENESAKQAMLVNYQDRQPYYPGWQTELQQLEDAEAVILTALTEDPANRQLITLLRQVQQKQLNLIDAVYSPRLTSL